MKRVVPSQCQDRPFLTRFLTLTLFQLIHPKSCQHFKFLASFTTILTIITC
jgi:hypothetical protein